MIYSMTAFARTQLNYEWGQAVWEIRTVNHRYLDISVRVPELFREWETSIRELINSHLHRGKVDCQLRFTPGKDWQQALTVNTVLVDTLLDACGQIESRIQATSAIKATDLLRWPDVLHAADVDIKPLKSPILSGLEQAIEQVLAMRAREGAALASTLEQRLHTMQSLLDTLIPQLPQFLQKWRDKLLQRLNEFDVEHDSQRLEQEMLLLAQKTDVAEELDRLQTHIQETQKLLTTGGVLGRKLDFLMQEFNREANTLASKAIDPTVTRVAVDLKVLIEQMREQIQNIV